MHMTLQKRFSRVDIAAILAFLAVWTYLIVRIRHFYYNPDEYYYLATAQKFALGARPLVDDWHIGQLTSLFLVLPYKLFVAIRGSTDGIILFSRALFLVFNAVFYWVMYTKLRAYKWPALVATLMFSTNITGGILACNYYNTPIRLVMIVCLILFSEKQSAASLLAAGVLLACAGIYQPLLFSLYLGYSLLVWLRFIRKKKDKPFLKDYDFCLNPRAWKYVSLSASLCMAAFLGWLFACSGVKNILTSMPYVLFTDSHHDFSTFLQRKLAGLFDFSALDVSDIVAMICELVIVILSIAFALGAFRNRRSAMQKILFCSICAVTIFYYVQLSHLYPRVFVIFGTYDDILFRFGLVCFLLCEQKNKRLFFFWIVGFFVSLSVDILSERNLSYGFPISYLADIVFFTELVRELYVDRPKAKSNKPAQAYNRISSFHFSRLIYICLALHFILSPLIMNTLLMENFLYGTTIPSLPAIQCEKGPAKSLFLREPFWDLYNKKLSDIDRIKQEQVKSFFVFGLSPELYLYADLPSSGACTWMTADTQALNQQIQYWQLHPENLPECIYSPVDLSFSEQDTQEFLLWLQDSFNQLCTYELQTGEGGFILYISDWDLGSPSDSSLFRDDQTK